MTGPADFTIPGYTAAAAPKSAASPHVIAVTEATFTEDVVERSKKVPVVLDLWADWCGPCKQLSPILERLAGEGNGSWVLALIDVDANPRLAQALQVQGIPAVKAVIDGQIVGEFTGAMPEAKVRDWITQLMSMTGPAGEGDAPEGETPQAPPVATAVVAAQEALRRGDIEGARAAYEGHLNENPADPTAKQGLALTRLLLRAESHDEAAVLAAGPDDVDATLARADLDVLDGRPDDAFTRLIDAVRATSDDDRDRVREHLVSLFEVLSPDDPRLATARRELANALF